MSHAPTSSSAEPCAPGEATGPVIETHPGRPTLLGELAITMNYSSPARADRVNYFTDPHFVHKVVIVTWSTKSKTTYWVNPPQGAIYWPFVARTDVWVQMDRLEPFPILPMQVTGLIDQDVRKEPSTGSDLTNFDLKKGESATIVEYRPSGSEVWGRLQNGNWIALFQYTRDGPTYYTTWSMATLPPPP